MATQRNTKGLSSKSALLFFTLVFAVSVPSFAGGLSDLLETLEKTNKVLKETKELGETLSGKSHGNSHGRSHHRPSHGYDHYYDHHGFHRHHGYNRFGYNRHGHYNPHYDTRRHH